MLKSQLQQSIRVNTSIIPQHCATSGERSSVTTCSGYEVVLTLLPQTVIILWLVLNQPFATSAPQQAEFPFVCRILGVLCHE